MSFFNTFRKVFFGCVRKAFSRRSLILALCLCIAIVLWRTGELAMPLNYATIEKELCRAGFTPSHMAEVSELVQCRTSKGSAAFDARTWRIPLASAYRVCSFEFEAALPESVLYRALDSADNDMPLVRASLLAFDGRRALILCRSEETVQSRWAFRRCADDILQRLDELTDSVSRAMHRLAEPASEALKEKVLEPEYWPHWSDSYRNLPKDFLLPVPFGTFKETPDPAKNDGCSMFIFYHLECMGHENCRENIEVHCKNASRMPQTAKE